MQLVQVRVELLGLVRDAQVPAGAAGRRGHVRAALRRRHLRILVRRVELIDVVLDLIERVVDAAELVCRVPLSDDFLALVQVRLKAEESSELLTHELSFELLESVRLLIHLYFELNIFISLRAFGNFCV